MTTLITWTLGGIGVGIFAASIFALWMVARLLSQNTKEQNKRAEEDIVFKVNLITNWQECNTQNRRQADALEKLLETYALVHAKPTLVHQNDLIDKQVEILNAQITGTNPNHEHIVNIMDLANCLYTTYCRAVGGVNFEGTKLPDWETFFDDWSKKTQSAAWIEVASKAFETLSK